MHSRRISGVYEAIVLNESNMTETSDSYLDTHRAWPEFRYGILTNKGEFRSFLENQSESNCRGIRRGEQAVMKKMRPDLLNGSGLQKWVT